MRLRNLGPSAVGSQGRAGAQSRSLCSLDLHRDDIFQTRRGMTFSLPALKLVRRGGSSDAASGAAAYGPN